MPYSRANGIDIWYEVCGEGPALILICPSRHSRVPSWPVVVLRARWWAESTHLSQLASRERYANYAAQCRQLHHCCGCCYSAPVLSYASDEAQHSVEME